MKLKNKEKIGNIDINVLQRELCKQIRVSFRTFPDCVLCLVRGDDIFEAEHLPSYARTYILPKQMVSHETLDSNKMTINFDES